MKIKFKCNNLNELIFKLKKDKNMNEKQVNENVNEQSFNMIMKNY